MTGGAVSISSGVTDINGTPLSGVKINGISNNSNGGYSSRGGSSAGDSVSYSRSVQDVQCSCEVK